VLMPCGDDLRFMGLRQDPSQCFGMLPDVSSRRAVPGERRAKLDVNVNAGRDTEQPRACGRACSGAVDIHARVDDPTVERRPAGAEEQQSLNDADQLVF
jgi:hypothetical protein